MFARILLLLSICLLHSCAVGPDFLPPPPPPTEIYNDIPLPAHTVGSSSPGDEVQYFAINHPIPAQWWMLFHSEALNSLIAQGFDHNPTIHAAQAALYQAEENFSAQVGTSLFPTVDLQAFANRQKLSGSTLGVQPSNTFNLFNTQVNVSYNLDIFGGQRRSIEALCALLGNQVFVLDATYLTLASNIVTTAITEASLREQRDAIKKLIASEKNLLEIIQKQFTLGAIAKSDVLAQQNQLAQSLATLPPLEKQLAFTRHALAALVGELPSENALPCFKLSELQLPTCLPVSLPSTMVRQRPDIRAAESLLHQASALIGVATANLFPQLTITGYYGFESNVIGDLFSPHASIWSITGQILQPIFHGGALLAKRRAAFAAYDQALAQYHFTVLQAFQNVADALRAIEIDAKTLEAQNEVEQTAKDLLKLTKEQYALGAVNYLNLLNAQRQYQQARINQIQAKAARYTDTAALFQALGGGWWVAA